MKMPDMPAFLLRNPDNTLKHPERWGPYVALKTPALAPPEDISTWSDARLAAEMDAATVTDRQPMIREATRREKKERARARIALMKQRLAEREYQDNA